MKKILIIMLLAAGTLLGQSFALQSGYPQQIGNDYEFYFIASAVDSGDISSNIIDLSDFGSDLANYPLGYDLSVDSLTAGAEIVGIYVQGKSSRGAWVTVDTLLVVDTLLSTSAHSGLTSGAANGILNLNFATKVFPHYRFLIDANHASGNTFTVKLSLLAYKRD